MNNVCKKHGVVMSCVNNYPFGCVLRCQLCIEEGNNPSQDKSVVEGINADPISFDDYQNLAGTTAIYPGRHELMGLLYVSIGAGSEAGEILGQVKRVLRDDNFVLTPERKEKIVKEIGDALWYLSETATEIGVSLGYCAMKNLEKLSVRKEDETLKGEGDDR